MMQKNRIVILSLASLFLIIGCEKETQKKVGKSGFDALSDDSVVMRVNGRELKKYDFIGYTVMRTELYKLASSSDKKKQDEIRRQAEAGANNCAADFVKNVIMLDVAERWLRQQGESAEPLLAESLAKIKGDYSYRGSYEKTVRTMKKAGVLPYFEKRMKEEAMIDAVMRHAFTNFNPVTDAGVSNYYVRVREHNLRAEATNRFIKAQAMRVLKAAQEGESFSDVGFAGLADRYSMDPDKNPGGDIGECDANDFAGDDAPLWEAISKLKVGDITDLLDAGDSWQIYRLVAIVPAEKSRTQAEARRLSRIYFRRAVVMEPLSDQEIRREMEAMRLQDIAMAITDSYLPDLKIEYPNGNVIPTEELEPFQKRAFELLGQREKNMSTNAISEGAK